jgi:arabinose-5-phosphate isomerase
VAGVVRKNGKLAGVITDGDVRRGILAHESFDGLSARDVMSRSPKTISGHALVVEALALMEEHSITSLFIVDNDPGRPVGLVHLHDLLKAGTA